MNMMKGKFLKMAAAAGKTPAQFAEANIHTDSEVGKLARLYYSQQGTHGRGKSNMSGQGDERSMGAKLYQIG